MITHPDQAKLLLVRHPQFSYALFQALLLNKIVPSDILERMLASSRGSSTSVPAATAPPSSGRASIVPPPHIPYSASAPVYPSFPTQQPLPTATPPASSVYPHQPAIPGQPYYRPPMQPAAAIPPPASPAASKPPGFSEISDSQRVPFSMYFPKNHNSDAHLLIRHF